jgi:hypothetical protein
MSKIAESEAETTHPAPAIATVARRADFFGLLVAHSLDAIYATAAIDAETDHSRRLPVGCASSSRSVSAVRLLPVRFSAERTLR